MQEHMQKQNAETNAEINAGIDLETYSKYKMRKRGIV